MFLLLSGHAALGAERWVPDQYPDIQAAIDDCNDGDTVVVRPGQYLETDPLVYDYIDFLGKNITLTSIAPNDPNIVENTIIGGAVLFSGTEDANCTLTGFKIHHLGYGGIYGSGTHATISHCIISGNGPCLSTVIKECDGTISNCLITDNDNMWGCEVWAVVYGCDGLIKNCTIANNLSGVDAEDGGVMTIENCIIYNNDGYQLAGGSGATLNVSYCNVQGGLEGIAGEVNDVNWGPGNIDTDPCFFRLGEWDYVPWPWNLVEGEYHLKSEGFRWSKIPIHGSHWDWDSVTSRCVDAGNPGSPLRQEPLTLPEDDPNNQWGENVRINMGAYGGTCQASMPPYYWTLLGDLNNDGIVDHVDLEGQTEDWLTSASEQPGDLSRDGIVDMKDFAALGEDWQEVTDWHE